MKPYPIRSSPPADWLQHIKKITRQRIRAAEYIRRSLSLAWLHNQAKRAQFCGHYWAEYAGEEGNILRQLKCHSRYCPACSREHTSRILTKIKIQERQIQPAYHAMITLSGGIAVRAEDLQDRICTLKELLRQWRRTETQKHGLLGGWYAFEVTYNAEKKTYNPHIHIYARYSLLSSEWIRTDRRFLKAYSPVLYAWTPAYMHIMSTWMNTMQKYSRNLYEALPESKLQAFQRGEIAALAMYMNIEYKHEKYISIDINNRYPNGKNPFDLIGYGEVEGKQKEVILKYVSKNLLQPPPEDNPMYLVPIMKAFNRARRCQGFGDLYNVPVSLAEILAEIEKETGEEIREVLTSAKYTDTLLSVDVRNENTAFGLYGYLRQFSNDSSVTVDAMPDERDIFTIHTTGKKVLICPLK